VSEPVSEPASEPESEPESAEFAAAAPRIVVYSRAGCHLCEVAEAEVAAIAAQTAVTWVRRDIDGDAHLEAEYAERIPVIVVDGQEHGYFRVDRERLLAALDGRRIY